jgi:hypothetical protein
MKKQDYNASITVNATAQEVFNAINNVRGWWSKSFEGHVEKLNDIFTVRFGDVYITSEIVEFIPGKKTVWHVMDCNKPWLKNTKEWNDTKMSWEISEKNKKTEIRFNHLGLVPEIECFDACSNAWSEYIQGSLFKLLTEGKGKPS